MADHSSTPPHSNHHAIPTPPSSNHGHNKNDNKNHHNNNQHTSSTTAIIANPSKTATKQNGSAANRSHSSAGISSKIILLSSNVPVMTDPYFGKPSPVNIAIPAKTEAFHSATISVTASTTPTVGSSNQQQQQIAGPLVGAILGTISLISIIVGVLVCIKRRKQIKRRQDDHIYSDNSRAGALFINQKQQQQRQRQQYATIKREGSNHSDSSTLQSPPTSYTPHCQKRLTADTLVDQRASLSTVNSNYSSRNNQYVPQLAYKQQFHEDYDVNKGQDDYYHLDGVSSSNTLIDTTAITMAVTADDKVVENKNSRRQRVSSYQPKVVAMTDDENINNNSNNEQHVPAGQQEQHATNNFDKNNYNYFYASDAKEVIRSNYDDYPYQSNYPGKEVREQQQQQQQHVNQQRQQNDGH